MPEAAAIRTLPLRAGDLADAPDAVIYPRSNQDVLTLLAFASERSIAVVPYGGGTSVVGGVTPRRFAHNGVLTVDLSEMDRVESIDREFAYGFGAGRHFWASAGTNIGGARS